MTSEPISAAPSASQTPVEESSGHRVALRPDEAQEAAQGREQAALVLAHIRSALDEFGDDPENALVVIREWLDGDGDRDA